MNSILIIILLILVIIYLVATRRKKVSLSQLKELILISDGGIMKAHKEMQLTHKKLNELYKAILSIEQGKIKKEAKEYND